MWGGRRSAGLAAAIRQPAYENRGDAAQSFRVALVGMRRRASLQTINAPISVGSRDFD